jgi:hypothetical protein
MPPSTGRPAQAARPRQVPRKCRRQLPIASCSASAWVAPLPGTASITLKVWGCWSGTARAGSVPGPRRHSGPGIPAPGGRRRLALLFRHPVGGVAIRQPGGQAVIQRWRRCEGDDAVAGMGGARCAGRRPAGTGRHGAGGDDSRGGRAPARVGARKYGRGCHRGGGGGGGGGGAAARAGRAPRPGRGVAAGSGALRGGCSRSRVSQRARQICTSPVLPWRRGSSAPHCWRQLRLSAAPGGSCPQASGAMHSGAKQQAQARRH